MTAILSASTKRRWFSPAARSVMFAANVSPSPSSCCSRRSTTDGLPTHTTMPSNRSSCGTSRTCSRMPNCFPSLVSTGTPGVTPRYETIISSSSMRTPNQEPSRALGRAHDLADQRGGLARGLADVDACLLERFLLRLGGAGRAGDDRTRVAHRLAFWRGEPGHVADDGLGDVLLDERGRALLGVAADLADHHDRRRLGIVLERPEAVDVRGADDRVATDAHGGRETDVAQFVHHLVGQRA